MSIAKIRTDRKICILKKICYNENIKLWEENVGDVTY